MSSLPYFETVSLSISSSLAIVNTQRHSLLPFRLKLAKEQRRRTRGIELLPFHNRVWVSLSYFIGPCSQVRRSQVAYDNCFSPVGSEGSGSRTANSLVRIASGDNG